ncbi:MAG: glycosyl transferase family 1, partial [Campylobacterales bacterium]|nr:glycosyl transferase family 1 [Campylobacterales bacterium]
MKVFHIITGISTGGAEKVLYRLLTSSSSKSVLVVSLTSKGIIGQQLEEKGFKVFALGLRAYNFPIVLYRLYRLIKLHQPDIVQT